MPGNLVAIDMEPGKRTWSTMIFRHYMVEFHVMNPLAYPLMILGAGLVRTSLYCRAQRFTRAIGVYRDKSCEGSATLPLRAMINSKPSFWKGLPCHERDQLRLGVPGLCRGGPGKRRGKRCK
jgi:hypothetical protein